MLPHLAKLFWELRAPAAWLKFGLSSFCIPRGAGSSALAGSPACAMPHGRVSHPAPTAAFSLSQQRGGNSVLQSAGCFPGDVGCAASPAEGWCLYCFTTSWLHSAKSGIWMKSKKKNPTSLALCRGRERCWLPTGDARGRGVSHPNLSCPTPGDADLLPEILQQHPSAVVVTYTSTP